MSSTPTILDLLAHNLNATIEDTQALLVDNGEDIGAMGIKPIVWQCGCVVLDRPGDALNRMHEQIHCREQIDEALKEVAAAAYDAETQYGWPALITANLGMGMGHPPGYLAIGQADRPRLMVGG